MTSTNSQLSLLCSCNHANIICMCDLVIVSSTYKTAFTLGRGLGPGAGPARARMFTLTFRGLAFSGPGSSGHGFPNRARRFGPGSGLIKPAF